MNSIQRSLIAVLRYVFMVEPKADRPHKHNKKPADERRNDDEQKVELHGEQYY